MGTQQNASNSTRLSLDIMDLPLTPFGMTPQGSPRKITPLSANRFNKLSRRRCGQPQGGREDKENLCGLNTGTAQHRRWRPPGGPTPSVLHTVPEDSSPEPSTPGLERQGPPHNRSHTTVNFREHADSPLREGAQTYKRALEEPNCRRDSLYTDIDEGSFIEFCHGKEKGHHIPRLIEDSCKDIPNMYYTCESENDTQYSTSTKTNNALVGFRKYLDTLRKARGLEVSEKVEVQVSSTQRKFNLECNESIITCSADLRRQHPNRLTEGAANSTVIEKRPHRSRAPLHNIFSEISTLTVPSEVVSDSDSATSPPATPPKYRQGGQSRTNIHQVVVISESSDEEDSPAEGAGVRGSPIRGSPVRGIRVGQRLFIPPSEERFSLVSEDVSIIESTSNIGTKHSAQTEKRNNLCKKSLSPDIASAVVSIRNSAKIKVVREDRTKEDNINNIDLNIQTHRVTQKDDKLQTPEKYNPSVVKWIMTSPFKESSHDLSILQVNDDSLISESPSQPKEDYRNVLLESPARSTSCGRSTSVAKTNANNGKFPLRPNTPDNHSNNESFEDVPIVKPSRTKLRVVVSTSDESGDDRPKRMYVTQRRKKKNRTNFVESHDKTCIAPSDSASEEESLKLKLSGSLSQPSQALEKTAHTIGRVATSPSSVAKAPVTPDGELAGQIDQKPRPSRPMRIVDSDSSDSDSEKKASNNSFLTSDASPKDIKIHAVNAAKSLAPASPKPGTTQHTGSGNEALDLAIIRKELDNLYSTDWRKNEEAILQTISRENKHKAKITESGAKKTSESEVSMEKTKESVIESDGEKEENSFLFQVSETSDDGEGEGDSCEDENSESCDGDKNSKNRNDESSGNSDKNEKHKSSDGEMDPPKGRSKLPSCSPPEDSEGDKEEDSFEEYLKKAKSKIPQNRQQEVDYRSEDLDQYESSFINDDSSDDSFSLPPVIQKPKSTATAVYTYFRRQSNVSKELEAPKTDTRPSKGRRVISTSWRDSPTITLSSDSDSGEFHPPAESKRPLQRPQPQFTPKAKGIGKTLPKTEGHHRRAAKTYETGGVNCATPTLSFLASLSADVNILRCHPEALIYTKNFKKKKEELTEKLYRYYNNHIFERKLPSSMNIKWNVRLTKTAGYCYYQIDRSKDSGRGSRIELSTKVIDCPERLRDTLIHELCHAAAWIISGYKDGHGPLWKAWAAKATNVFPELPAINRCHSYQIQCKYTYKCTRCSYSIGRHSKSLDTNRKVCGRCYGKFELITNTQARKDVGTSAPGPPKTPKTPGPFALFVKENYGSVKKSTPYLKHGDVMKILSSQFGKMKTTNEN